MQKAKQGRTAAARDGDSFSLLIGLPRRYCPFVLLSFSGDGTRGSILVSRGGGLSTGAMGGKERSMEH